LKNILLVALLILLFNYNSDAQIDNEFWFVAPEIASSHGDSPIFMRISTMDDTAEISLRLPADLSFVPITQKILPNTTFNIDLTVFKALLENFPPNMVHNNGMLLTSTKLITAYYECANGSNPGIFSLKGNNGLGTDFYVVSQNRYANHDGNESFDIIATEDNTVVTITPSDTIVGHKAGTPFTVVLKKGQTYSARAVYTLASRTLGGSHITSDKPIAVTWQDDSIITGGWDIVCDQTIPVNLLGKDYIAIKGFADNVEPGNNDERVYILATQDNTQVQVDGVVVSMLNAGQQYDHGIPSASNTAYIKTNKPVYVLHLSGHPGESGASILPQDSCTGSRKIGFNRSSTNAFALLILTRNGNQDSFYLNNNNTIITAANFSPVPGTSGNWVYYRQNNLTTGQVPVGANLIENRNGNFHLGILNNVGASSEYGYFSNFSSLYLGADASLCPGDSMVLDAGPFFNSYEWKKLIAGTWVQIDTNRFYTIHDAGSYACQTNGDFCTLMDTINVSFYPDASVTLPADTTICQGQTITIDPGLFVSYNWSTGLKTRYMTTGTAGTYWVQVINNNNCIAYDTIVISMDSLPLANHVISGPDSVCQGQTGVLFLIDSLHFATTYTWVLPPGASGTSDTSFININFPASATSGTLKVRGENHCGSGPFISFPVMVKPLPGNAGFVTGLTTVCQGQSGVVYTTKSISNATGYTWLLPPGATLVSGAGNDTITVNYGLAALSGNIRVFGQNGCGHSDTVTYPVTVNLFPQPAGAITGPAAVCQGQTGVSFSVPVITGAASYLWTLPAGAVIKSGAGTQSIIVDFDSLAVSGTVSVKGSSVSCGDGIPSSLALTVNPLPDPAGAIMGPTPVCQGQAGLPYNIGVIGNATSYIWTIPPGSVVTSGAGTNAITLDYPVPASGGLLTVRGHNALCGDGRHSTIAVTVNPLPVAAALPVGPGTICQLQSGIAYSVTPATFALAYAWDYSGSGVVIHNSGTTATLDFSSVATSGDLRVKGQNGCGDGPWSPLLPVTVKTAPQVTLQVCRNIVTRDAKPFPLSGGIPLNGTYSGDGVLGTIFTAASVPAWKDTALITYTYINVYGCVNTSTQKIKVFPVQPFTCGNSVKDVRDNKTYPTVKLGTQCWMAANLDHGITLPSVGLQNDNCIAEKYCYNDNLANCSTSGGLYLWDEVMEYSAVAGTQGLCMAGWHIPDESEWGVLFAYYISNGFAGSPLKYTGYSGFNALLDGARVNYSNWVFTGFSTLLWSSSPHGSERAWAHGMNSYNPSVSYYPSLRSNAFSVRCLKD
jgi:uncharacterized protein (TIGR02145 family)